MIIALDVPLPTNRMSEGSLRNVYTFDRITPEERSSIAVVATGIREDILPESVFGWEGGSHFTVLETPYTRYYLFRGRGVWTIHGSTSRPGSDGSSAVYPADFDGVHCFAMIQCLPRNLHTSCHFHQNRATSERWIATAGAATFLMKVPSGWDRSLLAKGAIASVEGQIHQTLANRGMDFESILVVHGTTREEHFKDHRHVTMSPKILPMIRPT